MKKLLIVFLSFICITGSYSQDPSDPNFVKVQNLRFDGDEFFDAGEYHLAAPYYEKVLSFWPEDIDANYKLGVCHLNSTHSKKALPYFEKIVDKDGVPNDILYEIARVYHLSHRFDEAIAYYEEAKRHIKGKDITIEDIDKDIERCNYGKELVAYPLDFRIENLGEPINTEYREHVPVISADEYTLIFTSRRPNTTGGKVYKGDGMFFEDVYMSQKNVETGAWGEPKNMGELINTKEHDASVGLSPDGRKLFIYRSKRKRNKVEGHIYQSILNEEREWSEPEILPDGLTSGYVELSASVSGDENLMFFSSNRPGGKGGMDIYQVKKLPNGEWAQPQNLEQLNTPEDDDAPFIHSDNRTLYFSSKGHQTMGGYDIFMSVLNEETGKWAAPQNMGYPVNTAGDDIYFVWSADGERGYFSSAREDNFGDLDIYVVHRPIIGKHFMVLKGTLIDEDTRTPVAGLIKLFNNENNKLVGVFNTSVQTGKFSAIVPPNATYRAEVSALGYDEKIEIIEVPDVDEYFEHEITLKVKKSADTTMADTVESDTVTEEVAVNEEVEEEVEEESEPEEGELVPGALIRSVLHGFDQAAHTKGSGINIDDVIQILKDNPWLVISIESHTDSKGPEEYNIKLSERRAASCKTYLLRRGISGRRVKVKYFGESKPIAPNTKPNGADNPEGRALNRRTEFRVVTNKPFK